MSDTNLDLDALESETKGEPYTFTFDGAAYELAPDLDLRAAAALEGMRLDEALRLLLGAEQWSRLASAQKTFTRDHLWALLEGYGRHLGIPLGNSSASTASLPTRQPRSRPTSSGTTTFTSANSSRAS